MYYNIAKTLQFAPYISFAIILIAWIIIEINCLKEQLNEKVMVEPIREGFIPPSGNGYEYYVDSDNVVYILQRHKKNFRIYITQGNLTKAKLKRDRYGSYFDIRAEDSGTVERIIDSTYKNSGLCG